MQAKQEKWDLYDQQGRKTGKTIQAGENVPYGYCLYCVGIWVIDSEKKILLTKRSSQKRYAPGKWENTGGHMISGETSRHAIVRELKEETGIQIEEDELIELGIIILVSSLAIIMPFLKMWHLMRFILKREKQRMLSR